MIPLDQLALGEKAEIEQIETDFLPLKLIEMGMFTWQLDFFNTKSSFQ